MSLLDLLSDESVWNAFYDYKRSLACPKDFTRELRSFIDEKRYRPVCEAIAAGRPFPLPRKSVISKMGSEKKRVVYTYPPAENTVLKLLTWLLLRRFDDRFCDGLYSFRPGRTAKDAVRRLLKETLTGDGPLYRFLASLLTESRVLDRGTVVTEKKGIMAGTPLSSFYANLFLSDLDRYFCDRGVVYARYSDDVIFFAPTREAIDRYAGIFREYLTSRELEVNPAKESYTAPGEAFTFLGFSCLGDRVDIAPATVRKLKQKMRRKRDALARWKKRAGTDGEKAAKAFIRVFNRKLFESPRDNELSWSSWFFPVINTADTLKEIDRYAQDCLRYLVSGRHTKGRYQVRYEDLKALGYRSLVNAFFAHEAEAASPRRGGKTQAG